MGLSVEHQATFVRGNLSDAPWYCSLTSHFGSAEQQLGSPTVTADNEIDFTLNTAEGFANGQE